LTENISALEIVAAAAVMVVTRAIGNSRECTTVKFTAGIPGNFE